MTRRADVWRLSEGAWAAEHTTAEHYRPEWTASARVAGNDPERVYKYFPTHAEALAWAIRQVVLAPKDGEDQ